VSLVSDVAKILKSMVGLATNKHVDEEFEAQNIFLKQAFGALRDEQDAQRVLLLRILAAVEPLPAVKFVFTVDLEGQILEGVTSITMKDNQQATASIQPVDSKGNPATLDGVPVWASSDETIVTVEPATDGLSALVKATGPVGTAKVSVTGDADMGEGTKPIFGQLDVDVTAGEAVSLTMKLSDPTDQ